MNITPFTIYLLTRADVFLAVLEAFIGALICYLIVSLIFVATDVEDNRSDFFLGVKRAWKYSFPLLMLLVFLKVITPTTKEMAAIIVIPAIANNQEVQDLGAEIPKLAREWLEELKPKK